MDLLQPFALFMIMLNGFILIMVFVCMILEQVKVKKLVVKSLTDTIQAFIVIDVMIAILFGMYYFSVGGI